MLHICTYVFISYYVSVESVPRSESFVQGNDTDFLNRFYKVALPKGGNDLWQRRVCEPLVFPSPDQHWKLSHFNTNKFVTEKWHVNFIDI